MLAARGRVVRLAVPSGALFSVLALLQVLPGSPGIPATEGTSSIPESPEELIPESFTVPVPDPESLRHGLLGGAVAFVAPDPALPLVEVVVVVEAGEALDSPDRRGLAGLTAAMLRRGGAGDLPPDAFDLQADRIAAEIDSFSGVHRAGAVLDVAAWRLEEGLDLFFRMLARPRFDRDRFRLLRQSLAEGLEAGASDPAVLGSRAWERLTALPGEPFSTPLEADAVMEIELADLEEFHRRHWRPEGLVFAVSGAVNPQEIVRGLNRRLREWIASPSPEGPGAKVSPGPGVEAGSAQAPEPGIRILERPTDGAVVLAGHRLDPGSTLSREDRYAAVLLEELIAGDGGVNRLVGRLRTDRGLVYGIDSELELASERRGRWLSLFHCEADRVGRALEAWREEVERLRSEPVNGVTLSAARTAVLGRLRSRFDTASGVAGTYAEDALTGRPHGFWLGLEKGLEDVGPERLRSVAIRLLRPEEAVLVVVGPRSRIVPGLAAAELPGPWRDAIRSLPAEGTD